MDYIAEDGLKHCGTCGSPKEFRYEIFGQKRLAYCKCKCEKDQTSEIEKRLLKESHDTMRSICFQGQAMSKWTFGNDDKQNEDISEAMKNYVANFAENLKTGKGLILYGDVGTGKTYYTACIANALIDLGYSCLLSNFSTMADKTFVNHDYADMMQKYSLVVLDDLGAERNTEYMKEQVFKLIDARYRSGKPFIITTNLTWGELTNPDDQDYQRIFDRVLERCTPIKVDGASRRREHLKKNYQTDLVHLGIRRST